MHDTSFPSSSFAQRLAHAVDVTGLSPAELGIARVYERAHSLHPYPSDFFSTPPQPHQQSPLYGQEVLIKDLQQVEGEIATFGSERLSRTAMYHDSAARRLLSHGAILVGASSTSEFGATAYTEPVGQVAPVNPLNPEFMCGGSSGGAAVAVARGLVDIAHATDGGGSIRIPAACCGLVGLKPVHDNSIGGFTPVAHGFLAKDLYTTARAYGLQLPELSSFADAPLRIGYTNRPFHSLTTVDPQIAAATAAVTGLLASTPAVESVIQAPAPYAPEKFSLFTEFFASHCTDLPAPLSPITSWLKEQGRMVDKWRLEKVHAELQAVQHEVSISWQDLDLVATPMLACAPPPPGTFSALEPRLNFLAQTAWTPWGTLWNMTGWACVSVPLVHPTKVPGRWPISLLLGAVSDRVSEGALLALARSVQHLAGMLPAESLSLAAPGDIEKLGYRPTPAPHTLSEHGHGDRPCH
ncbi:amidase [Corynebacterium anserum]|uniref:amidase n=1 Tax=Corynebacterium anserum TaxID=2684406 RepID=A0A7G7YLL2_9CORY|nr:amidase [Corynebacterium anserum]QNH95382.1 amidase [Corynebacterium anserum]